MSDTLETLKAALAPKAGMRRIAFPTESYQHPSPPLSSKRLVNLMAEKQPADARNAVALVSTPGAVFRENLAGGVVYAFNTDLVGGYYAVCGDQAFRNVGGVTTNIGTVGTAADALLGPDLIGVSIAVSQDAVVICVPPRAYTADHAGALNLITGTFPGANSVTYLDNYFVFSQTGRGVEFFVSAIDDPTMYAALDFASLEGNTNIILTAITQKDELWLGGSSGWEVWYDTGEADFPFRRRAGGILTQGIATPKAVAQVDGSVFWLNDNGTVFRSSGYQAVRVSTHAIEAIMEAGTPSQAKAVAYVQEGHAFYCLTLGNRTVCYDCATNAWHDRSSTVDGSGPWLATVAGRIGEGAYVGDAAGNLYTLTLGTGVDAGVQIPRQFVLPPLYAGTYRAFCNRLEIEMEVGTALSTGYVTLEWSNDGGDTWTGLRSISAGATGALRTRVYATRLGSFRQRVFRVTSVGAPTYYAVDADIGGGVAG